MATIKFMIRFSGSEDPQSVYVTSRFGRDEKLMYATPLKVESIFWDERRQRVKASRYCTYRDDVNDALNSLESKLNEFMSKTARDGGDISKESLRRFLDRHFCKRKDPNSSFHQFYESYVESLSTKMNVSRGGQVVTYRTRREYINTLNMIKRYESENRIHIDFNDIDQDFLSSFVAFLQRLDYSTNTVYRKITNIKAVMNAAVERGVTDNVRWRYFRKTSEETEAVALNEDELQRLKDYDFSSNPRLERVRDLFLVGCWTGLRFSDVTRIREENIQDGIITITQSKTNAPVSIPVHPVFGEIWDKYGGNLPVNISNQKFNEYIKEVCREVGLRDSVLKSITKGGRKITTSYEKWQRVTSHTARRSFATNLYKSGFPSISIMQITGHRTEAAFLRYIKVSKQEHAKLLAEHWKNTKSDGSI